MQLYCPLVFNNPSGFQTGLQVHDASDSTAAVNATYYSADGTRVLETSQNARGRNTVYFPPGDLPDGFAGSVVLSADVPIAAFVNGAPGGGFGGYACGEANLPPVYGRLNERRGGIVIQNLSSSDATSVDLVYTDRDGVVSQGFHTQQVGPGAVVQVPAVRIIETGQRLPGSAVIFTPGGGLVVAGTTIEGAGGTLEGFDLADVDSMACSPTPAALPRFDPGSSGAGSTFHVQNLSAAPDTIVVLTWDRSGNPTIVDNATLQPTAVKVYKPFADGKANAFVCAEAPPAGRIYLPMIFKDSGSRRPRGAAGSGAWPSSSGADVITKRAYAFGAPSSRESKVSIILHNVGGSVARVKLRVFDGDTGKKRMSRTAKVGSRATAAIPFNQKARGNNLNVEIIVKGKGRILAWLSQEVGGDIDFFRATRIR